MKKIKKIIINGYIEGYYGNFLSWKDRKKIILSLKKNNMSYYLYAPKEDLKHRSEWRTLYGNTWLNEFKLFNAFAKKNNVKVIAGISPGLDFNFNGLSPNLNNNTDFEKLLIKIKQLINCGSENICLLLDDIPNKFNKNFNKKMSEGKFHAILVNKLSLKLKKDIFFVPRVYANELELESPKYINEMMSLIGANINLIFCGKNVVSKKIDENDLNKLSKNNVIIWDNYYANDYCPRRLFVGPTYGRKNIPNILFNLTGLIETDLLILDIIALTKNSKTPSKDWEIILVNHNIPFVFLTLKAFFKSPNFNDDLPLKKIKVTNKQLIAIEFLLWDWKSKLKIEWYPYLFGLKHDLQLSLKKINTERLVKTQTNPLSHILLRKKNFN